MMIASKLSAGHGWQWIKEGWVLFRKSPALWMALTAVGLVGMVLVASIPTMGDPLASLLFPVLMAGYMLGCLALVRGEELEIAHLLAGFQHSPARLISLGGVSLLGQYLIYGVMTATGGGKMATLLMSGQPVEDASVFTDAMNGAGLALFLGMLLSMLMLLAGQFAPMLVVFRNLSVIEALKSSLFGCFRNIAALSVYGGSMLLLGIVASMPMMLGWVVLLPLMLTSVYAAYCDLFPGEAARQESRVEDDLDYPPESD
jgi:hypothetical protein